jgi:hypothetical protein
MPAHPIVVANTSARERIATHRSDVEPPRHGAAADARGIVVGDGLRRHRVHRMRSRSAACA